MDLEQVGKVRTFFERFAGTNKDLEGFIRSFVKTEDFGPQLFDDLDTILSQDFTTGQPDEAQDAVSVSDLSDLQLFFKYSASLTETSQKSITRTITKFSAFLSGAGVDLPSGTPPIAIVTTVEGIGAKIGSGSGASAGTKPISYDDVRIAVKDIANDKAVSLAYGLWVIMRLFPAEYPLSHKPVPLVELSRRVLAYSQIEVSRSHRLSKNPYLSKRSSMG